MNAIAFYYIITIRDVPFAGFANSEAAMDYAEVLSGANPVDPVRVYLDGRHVATYMGGTFG